MQQCEAWNGVGEWEDRCELPVGHDGPHRVTIDGADAGAADDRYSRRVFTWEDNPSYRPKTPKRYEDMTAEEKRWYDALLPSAELMSAWTGRVLVRFTQDRIFNPRGKAITFRRLGSITQEDDHGG